MFKLIFTCFICSLIFFSPSVSAFMQLPPLTREDLQNYYDKGCVQEFPYMIWYLDHFSFEDFVHFVPAGSGLKNEIESLKNNGNGIIKVFDLSISFEDNTKLERNWWSY